MTNIQRELNEVQSNITFLKECISKGAPCLSYDAENDSLDRTNQYAFYSPSTKKRAYWTISKLKQREHDLLTTIRTLESLT